MRGIYLSPAQLIGMHFQPPSSLSILRFVSIDTNPAGRAFDSE